MSDDIKPCLHFVAFRDDRYWSAVRIWGRPHFIHRGFDLRARRDIDPSDTVVFAEGDADQAPRVRSYDDVREDPRPSGAASGEQGRAAP